MAWMVRSRLACAPPEMRFRVGCCTCYNEGICSEDVQPWYPDSTSLEQAQSTPAPLIAGLCALCTGSQNKSRRCRGRA